jgi:hypothetical protein
VALVAVLGGLLLLGSGVAVGFGLGYMTGAHHEHERVEDLIQDHGGAAGSDDGFGWGEQRDRQGGPDTQGRPGHGDNDGGAAGGSTGDSGGA